MQVAGDEKKDPSSLLTSNVGSLSAYTQKLAGQLWVWTGSNVLWGSNLDVQLNVTKSCNGHCVYNYLCGAGSFLFLSFILLFNYLCETHTMSRSGWFSYKVELFMMYALAIWWIPGVAVASSIENPVSGVGEVWAYLSLFGSIFVCFAAYRAYRVEQYKEYIVNRLLNRQDDSDDSESEGENA
ncbi:hypothetical protein FVE85_2752 [Porphyridium purpureum]|uniref:Uncharacterized protein n=1 Tax=Porphyridium purpureum TaxID=35688 RepID=A0A5J4YSN9_PORPP|nr:hypothetical protein FVE85_2752 [Porphyridium purpureum]|eukprot:POR6667..scf227_4